MDQVVTLAGIAWDPHIRGVLSVLTGAVILMGSVYLILYTNVGTRLGFLLAAGGFFGWMFILSLTWWIQPPAIGPRGHLPEWKPLEIVYGNTSEAAHKELRELPSWCFSSISRDCEPVDGYPEGVPASVVIREKHAQVFREEGEEASLSDLAGVDEELVAASVPLRGWEIRPAGEAAEAQAVIDALLVEERGIFGSSEDYRILDAFGRGGKKGLPPDPNRWDRISTWIRNALTLRHPPHYLVVQLQHVVRPPAKPGEAPPPPRLDTRAPVISVLLVRDLGTLRVPGALATMGSGLMFGLVAFALHRRDRLAEVLLAEGDGGS